MASLSDAARAYLNERRFAVLATINEDGTPQQTVMWYELRDEHVMMNTAAGRLKQNNIRRDPRVSICVEDGYRYVTIRGTATVVEDRETTQRDIYALAQRYNPGVDVQQKYAGFRREQRETYLISIDAVIENGL
jgi:PPOX class probable F420-dependent enzyme